MLRDILQFGTLPLLFDEEGGDAGGGASGGGGDAGGDAGDTGEAGGDAGGDTGDTGDAGDNSGDTGGDAGDTGDGDQEGGDAGDDKSGGDEGDKGDAGDGEKTGVWSEEWREAYADGDEKKLAYLKRFNSPSDLMDKVFEQDKMIRSGGHKKEGLGENPTDEEVAKYREENGIPEKADGYLDKLPDGLVLGEDIVETTQPYLEAFHDMNAPPELVASMLEKHVALQEETAAAITARDDELSTSAIAELKETWGTDYGANMQAMHNFIAGYIPADMKDAFEGARLGDDEGTPLFSSAAMIEVFSKIQREINPLGAQTSGSGMDNIDAIEDQIKTYEGQMGTKAWYKDEKAQKHYRELISARDRFKVRS